MARAAPEQAQTDNAIAGDHDGGEYRIARQPSLLRRGRNHDRDDKRHLDDGHGDGQDKRAEWLADAVRDHFSVVYGRKDAPHEGGAGGRHKEAASARKGRQRQNGQTQRRPNHCPPGGPRCCHR
jgi:hypothetical protein